MSTATRYLTTVVALIAGVAGSTGARAQATEAVALSVNDPRPVKAAVLSLIHTYPISITYEDPRYEYPGDLRDITDQIAKSGQSPPKVRTLVPNGGALEATYEVSRETGQLTNAAGVLHSIVAVQNARGLGGRFAVTQSGEAFHVVPTEVRDVNGAWVRQTSVLETPLNFSSSEGELDGYTLLQTILDAVTTATGQRFAIVVGRNMDVISAYKGGIAAKNERAQDVLFRMLQSISPQLTWLLNYDYSEQEYFFNVMASAARPQPEVPVNRRPPPKRGDPTPGGPAFVPRDN